MLGVIVQVTAISTGASGILAGRFIVGMAVGSLSMTVVSLSFQRCVSAAPTFRPPLQPPDRSFSNCYKPMYVAECSPPEVRGLMIGMQQFAIEFGIMISFWIDYGAQFWGGTGTTQAEGAWLLPICLQLFPALILLVGMIWMPFTPRWLVHHGREAEARRTLATLRDMPEDSDVIELEFLEIKAQSLFEKRTVEANFPHLSKMTAWNTVKLQFVSIGSLFKTMPMFRRVIVATVTMFFQQWTGYVFL